MNAIKKTASGSVRITPDVLKEAKVICAITGQSIQRYVTVAVVEKNKRERSKMDKDGN
jgi:hypothetical protein